MAKEIAEYEKEQQALDRQKREDWREAQRRQVEIWMAELQTEERKRADELQAEKENRADEIRMAQIEKERTLGERDGITSSTSSSSCYRQFCNHSIPL